MLAVSGSDHSFEGQLPKLAKLKKYFGKILWEAMQIRVDGTYPLCCMVWYGMVRTPFAVWCGMVRTPFAVWCGMVRTPFAVETVWCGMVWHGIVWHGMVAV